MQTMTDYEYIKKYCDNKYSVFSEKAKNFPHTFEQVAFYDRHIWIDEENEIEIVNEFYIGD